MTGLGQQITRTQKLCHNGSLSAVSKTVAALHLMYYHVSVTPAMALNEMDPKPLLVVSDYGHSTCATASDQVEPKCTTS